MLQKHHHPVACENCGSEKRGGLCLLCGEGERTTQFTLPRKTDYDNRRRSIDEVINAHLGNGWEDQLRRAS